jgi:tetratricopeptide (TPR) repeat protein/transcriptional regulator with XRE-family HTH domain
MAEDGQAFGRLLREWRTAAQLTQEQLAERSGLGTRTIRDLERGRVTRPRRQSIELISAALNLPPSSEDQLTRAGHQPPLNLRPALALRPAAIPRQLPPPIRHFVGRADALRSLNEQLGNGLAPGGTAMTTAIGGPAGVGKTALAIHWAHQAADRFPDGQLYTDLRGFSPLGPPTTAEAAIRGFLDALGVPAERLPGGLEAQAVLHRSLLAERRMFVLLDNAQDAAQVRPLLPGSGNSMVVVTSRGQLDGLAVAEGARQISLDVLTETESADVLGRHLAAGRTASEPSAAAELTTLCARLPLALAIVAGRAAASPGVPLAVLAADLREAGSRLDALATGDEATDVRAVFSWSVRHLSDAAARMFRLLGCHPCWDISAAAAASLTGLPLPQAHRTLRELCGMHLLTEHVASRFTCHDLLRIYAIEQSASRDSESERRAAIHRVLDHYLHTGHRAALLLSPSRVPLTLAPAQPGASPENLADHQEAIAWFQAQHQVMLAGITAAAASGLDAHAWQIPWTMASFLQSRGYWDDYAATQRAALEATQRLGDLPSQMRTQYILGLALGMSSAFADATAHFGESLALSRQLGDSSQQARSHAGLSWMFERQGRYESALDHAQQALELYRSAGDRVGQSEALNAVGWDYALLGSYADALACCQQALTLVSEADGSGPRADILDSIGYAHHNLGNYAQAITSYMQALDIYRQHNDHYRMTTALRHLGDTYYAIGDFSPARDAWQQALKILDEMHHPDADLIHVQLKDPALGSHPAAGPC